MKKSFSLLIVCGIFAAFLFSGCKKDDDPQLKLSESELVFTGMETKSLFLSVEPYKKCTYQVTSYPKWLEINPVDGIFNSAEIHELKITPIYDVMQHGVYEGNIVIASTLGEKTVHVKCIVIHHLYERKIRLESDVIDVEYSRKKEMMVYVASNPMKLYFFYTKTNAFESIDLDFTPTCISISPDQNYAVVGHEAHISYVDLVNKNVIRTYKVSCDVFDIVFGDNNWAYVFPKSDNWEDIRCIDMNLPNDNETLHTGAPSISGNTRARLFPAGGFIYGADTNLLPSDIEKYSIKNGTAEYLYDSQYHGTYPMEGNLWFSEDGSRIFTRGQTVVTASQNKSYDMLYNGTIVMPDFDYYSYIQWLDHSSNATNLYILAGKYYWENDVYPFLYIHDASNLSFKKKIALEKYSVGNNQSGMKEYDAIPYFVFSNSNGDEVVVVTKAKDSGLEHEWAIEKITITD